MPETPQILVYIAKRLNEAKAVEAAFEKESLGYEVEPDRYMGGFLFKRELIGAFFYVSDDDLEKARSVLRAGGWKPYEPEP